MRRRAVYRRQRTVPLWAVVLVLVVLAAVRFWPELDQALQPEQQVDPAVADREYLVQRVVDGDTLLLANRDRVRLLGVDTPETVAPDRPVEPFGKAAAEFTRLRVEGRRVRLGFDKERVDRFGRILAYVYLEDGSLLNEELIRAGLSEAQLQYPYSAAMKRRFRAAEAEAREAQRGLWSVQLDESRPPPARGDRAA